MHRLVTTGAFTALLCTVATTTAQASEPDLTALREQRRLERLAEQDTPISVIPSTQYRTLPTIGGQTLEQRAAARRAARLQDADIAPHAAAPINPVVSSPEHEVIALVNQERAAASLPALRFHADLAASALAHARDMERRGYFAHETPEGRNIGDRIKATGYLNVDFGTCNCAGWNSSVGENIAKGDFTAKSVVEAWMNSPSHRDNILSPDFAEIGIGIAGDVWVQNFGRLTLVPLQ